MCTAITYKTKDNYFGRTLDIECSFGETVTITPRKYPFEFRLLGKISSHYAIIGMAKVLDDYPLYYEATNEHGLSMAGLNFPNNAHYFKKMHGKDNVAPFEFIPWILSQCKNMKETKMLLSRINLCNINYSPDLPLSPLHWIISDGEKSVTVESTEKGLDIFENTIGVLTNNPTFDYHMTHLCDYINLSSLHPENRFGNVDLTPYSRGMGGIGLPGDLSSASRFVRASFVKLNSESGESESESISQFFHILSSVEQQRGCVILQDGKRETTLYSSCINTNKGIYYYKTYENSCISSVDMYKCNLEESKLYIFPLLKEQIINRQN